VPKFTAHPINCTARNTKKIPELGKLQLCSERHVWACARPRTVVLAELHSSLDAYDASLSRIGSGFHTLRFRLGYAAIDTAAQSLISQRRMGISHSEA
jgi:hypothetical protein